jgi:hypothetical protein
VAYEYDTVEHQFRAGETIYGVIKNYNNINMTEEDYQLARIYYLIENSEAVRRAGESVKIPILPKYQKR